MLFQQLADVGIQNLPYCSFDFCAIVINAIVLINFAINKKIRNAPTNLFYVILACSLSGSVFSLLNVLGSVFYMPSAVCNAFKILYALFYNLAGVVFFIYVVKMINENFKGPLWCFIASAVFCVLMTVGLLLYALSIFGVAQIAGGVYASILYGVQLAATVCSVALVVRNRQNLSSLQCLNVYLFSVFNAVADVFQLLLAFGVVGQQIQISTFTLSVAVLLAYITLQRPEEGLDPVSGTFNQSAYQRRTNERLNSGRSVLVYVFEICNMPVINATFGVKGGNSVLRQTSTRIQGVLPENQYLFRMGGARFAINFENESEYGQFEPKCKAALEAPLAINGTQIRITYIGCLIPMPSVTDSVSDIEKILKYYRSVATASDKVLVADKEVLENSHRREQVEYAIQNALNCGGFEVYYQPIYSVGEKRIKSCEALIRLKDAELGVIGPDEFIPVAEETGRIVKIGRFVMEEVCKFINEDKPQDYGIDFIDVNLSVIQCIHPEIIEDINGILARYDVPKSMVNLEVTETASAKSSMQLQSRLKELHGSGFTLSLDDFGSGFSSVEYLIKFPFDIVKLDKSLVWAYMSTKKYAPILKHYMPMLHGLGYKIVAEGVETKEMLTALEKLGCDYIQGYYFSRPLPKAQFLEYIKKAADGVLTA